MKYLFHLGHPAHFHLFKNTIKQLKQDGHEVAILIKKKDILEELLQESGLEYHNLLPHGRKDSKFGIALGMIETDIKLFRFALRFKPNIMIGTSYAISHVGKLLNIPSINVNEDDAAAVPLYAKFSYPWASVILSPQSCNNGKWESKSIKYPSYHELAYLHPNVFTPSKEVVRKYIDPDKPFFLIRFAKLTAHHDSGVKGIYPELAEEIINILKPYGNIYITSERELEPQFESYRLKVNPLDIHHLLAFAKLYIGDSQTMAAEAGVLGTPYIRFSDFVGKLGYLNELEEKYQLGFGIRTSEPDKFLTTIRKLLTNSDTLEQVQASRMRMLIEKMDLSKYLSWFIANYPQSLIWKNHNQETWNDFK